MASENDKISDSEALDILNSVGYTDLESRTRVLCRELLNCADNSDIKYTPNAKDLRETTLRLMQIIGSIHSNREVSRAISEKYRNATASTAGEVG